jgi:pilus assembly protein Flp/PilA
MLQLVKSFWQEEEGVTAIEYGLIAALIAIVIIVALTAAGQNLDALWGKVCTELKTAVGATGVACP